MYQLARLPYTCTNYILSPLHVYQLAPESPIEVARQSVAVRLTSRIGLGSTVAELWSLYCSRPVCGLCFAGDHVSSSAPRILTSEASVSTSNEFPYFQKF